MLLSCIPRKELRFVFPALPLLNLCAAVACERLWRSKLLRIIVLGIVAATLAATLIVFAPASRNNYPGADLCGDQILLRVRLNRRVDLHAIDATPA